MIIAFAIISPLLIVCSWAFFYWSPKGVRHLSLTTFNVGTCVIALALSLLFTFYIYARSEYFGADTIWLSVLSTLGWFFIYPTVLFAAALLRNFVLFRDASTSERTTVQYRREDV